MSHTPATEVVKDLLDVIDNDDVLYGNRRALAVLDAEELDTYITNLKEQIEETEYLFYNSDEWVDKILPEEVDKLEDRIIGEIEITDPIDTIRITELLEEFTKDLTKQIGKQMMIELAGVNQVYTI